MEENKPLVTETEFPESDTDIISGDGTPITDTSDQNVDTVQKESNTSKSDSEESTENSSTTNTEENGVEEDTTTEIVTDPTNDPATLESALLVSTYAALSKLADYVPTEYVNNSEPDIDAEHLNNTEQGLLRVTNLLNGAVDVINDLQTTVAKQASAIDTLNSKGTVYEKYNTVDAIKGTTAPITTIELPAGNYMIFALTGVNSSQAGMMSCALKASTGRLSSMEMRGISDNGGGILSCAYFTTTTKSTVTSFGYGYNSGDYKYESLIIAVKL